MKKMLLMVILVIAGHSYAFSKTNSEVIMAVTDFQIQIEHMPVAYGNSLAALLRSQLVQNRAVSVVERDRLASILKTLNILPEELAEPSTAVKLSKMLQINYVVFGAISEVFHDTIISARLIDISKGKIVTEYSVEYDGSRKVSDLMDELSNKICSDIEVESFVFDAPRPNQQCTSGSLSASGQHALSADGHVWLVLKDNWGFYPQNANVNLGQSGQWSCNGVYLGNNIKQVVAVLVNEQGHAFFLDRVRRNDWRQFNILPEGTRILASVPITVK